MKPFSKSIRSTDIVVQISTSETGRLARFCTFCWLRFSAVVQPASLRGRRSCKGNIVPMSGKNTTDLQVGQVVLSNCSWAAPGWHLNNESLSQSLVRLGRSLPLVQPSRAGAVVRLLVVCNDDVGCIDGHTTDDARASRGDLVQLGRCRSVQ